MNQLTTQKFLTDEELFYFRQLLKNKETKFPRQVLLMELTFITAARATEILNIEKKDLNYSERSVFIRGLKGSLDREIPLNFGLFEKLKKHAEACPTDKLFNISYNYFHKLWTDWRPAKKKLHSLRHTRALQVYRKTQDIKLVQMLLGHKNPMNTHIYLNFVYSNDQMRRLLNVL